MGFKAEPGSIRKFSEQMEGLVVDANAAKHYAEDHLEISGSDARIFATVAGAAADAKAALSENYQRLAKIQQSAASELDRAAAMYQETDEDKAERIDATYQTWAGQAIDLVFDVNHSSGLLSSSPETGKQCSVPESPWKTSVSSTCSIRA